MSIACSWPRESRCQRAASTPISSRSSSRKTTSPSLRHLARLAALGQVDELVDEDLHVLRVAAERARDRLQACDVAVMVRAEHVDERSCPRFHLSRMCGTSTAKYVGRPSERRRPRSCRPPTRSSRASALLPSRRARSRRAPRRRAAPSRSGAPRGPCAHGSARASRGCAPPSPSQVRCRARPARPRSRPGSRPAAAPPPAPRVDRLVEEVDLRAAVVDVELALDGVAREVEQAGDGISVRRVPGGGDRQRPRGVRGDEYLHLLRARRRSLHVIPTRGQISPSLAVPDRVELKVDEAGRGDGGVFPPGEPLATTRSSSAISIGDVRRIGAARMAAFVA